MVLYDRMVLNRENNCNGNILMKMLEENDNTLIDGVTKATLEGDVLKIQHSGSINHTVQNSVNLALEKMNIPNIDELKILFQELSVMGKPHYYYIIKFQL